ncbi:MAG: hypothetical protein JO001_15275 [Alphaproteobacteria bacterium]|nr:hypothetical protein [Alphaproteobacteria bacterium]
MHRYVKLAAAAAVVAVTAGSANAAGMRYTIHHHHYYHHHWWVESPAQNLARSAYYDRLLQVSPRFRAYRMRKECGPIRFIPELRQECLASFDTYEPMLR